MTDTPETPKPLVSESGEYENLMDLAAQNKQKKLENPDAFASLFQRWEIKP